MSNLAIDELYHGFKIEGQIEDPSFFDYHKCIFRVTKEGKLVFRHSVQMSADQGVMSYPQLGKAEINQVLLQKGFKRVCGKIDLQRYQQGEDTEYRIPEDDLVPKKQLTAKEIRLEILNVLYRITLIEGQRAAFASFNIDGFCEILGIEKADYRMNVFYLCQKGYAKDSPVQQFTRDQGGIYITADGIDYLEEGGNLKPAINITNVDTGGGPFINRDVNTGGGTFVGRDKNLGGNPTPEKPISKDALSDEAKEILRLAYMSHTSNTIIIAPTLGNLPPEILAGDQSLPREMKYNRAIKKLRESGLIRQVGGQYETYELTGRGDEIAETLLKAG